MERSKKNNGIDQHILQILSIYEHLNLLELWFEMGEAGILESMTRRELLDRLQSLKEKGYVERLTAEKGNIRWALKRNND